jgi:beta-glucosidase
VLLKNEGVLPLNPSGRLLVVGEQAAAPRYQGGGSSHVNAARVDVPLQDIRAAAEAASGYVLHVPDAAGHLDAVAAAAADVDVAVVFAGLPEEAESEGFDRTTLELPGDQVELIQAVAAAAPATVVVLANGGVVTMEGWHEMVAGILEGFLLGQAAGGAIADLLFGTANPSGRLAETIPARLEDTPTFLNFPGEQGHVRYGEGIMLGYRHYVTVGRGVRYPFGHGLSYTTFAAELTNVTVDAADRVSAEVRVTNTGTRAGKEVVQLYVASDCGPVRRPARVLAAFTKVEVDPGRSAAVRVELDPHAFGYWDLDLHRWVIPPGKATVQLCRDAATVIGERAVQLHGNAVAPQLTVNDDVAAWLAHPSAGPALRAQLNAAAAARGHALDDNRFAALSGLPMQQMLGLLGGAIDATWLRSLLGDGATA